MSESLCALSLCDEGSTPDSDGTYGMVRETVAYAAEKIILTN